MIKELVARKQSLTLFKELYDSLWFPESEVPQAEQEVVAQLWNNFSDETDGLRRQLAAALLPENWEKNLFWLQKGDSLLQFVAENDCYDLATLQAWLKEWKPT